jgi:hypothetical protein
MTELSGVSAPQCELQFVVRTIAQGLATTVFAAAKIDGVSRVSGIFNRCEAAAFMRAVAKWLRLALAAGAPPIVFSCFDLGCEGRFLRNIRMRIGHDVLLKKFRFDLVHYLPKNVAR